MIVRLHLRRIYCVYCYLLISVARRAIHARCDTFEFSIVKLGHTHNNLSDFPVARAQKTLF